MRALAWSCVVLCGLVWYCVVLRGLVRSGAVWCGIDAPPPPRHLNSLRLASPRLASPHLASLHLTPPCLVSPRRVSPHFKAYLASPYLASPRVAFAVGLASPFSLPPSPPSRRAPHTSPLQLAPCAVRATPPAAPQLAPCAFCASAGHTSHFTPPTSNLDSHRSPCLCGRPFALRTTRPSPLAANLLPTPFPAHPSRYLLIAQLSPLSPLPQLSQRLHISPI